MNNYFNNLKNYSNKEDIKLKEKLKKQAGDNMKFNIANYNNDSNPSQLYDVYSGFIRGNMFPELYNQYKIKRPYDIKPMNKQAEMLTKVDAYCFASHELNLYLDTHPNDRDMINLFRELKEDSKRSIDEYENNFGPLFTDASISYPWQWNLSPWPWENS